MALQSARDFQLGTDFSQFGRGIQQGQQIAAQFQIGQERDAESSRKAEQSRVLSVIQGASEIQNIPTDELKLSALLQRKNDLIQQRLPTQDTDEVIALFQSGNSKDANALIDGVVNMGIQQGVLKSPSALSGLTAEQREFKSLTKDLSKADELKARRVKLRLDPPASLSAAERIALDDELSQKIADVEALKAKGKETGKLEVQAELLPSIRGAIKKAEKEATVKGETFTALNRAKAALPGLKDVTAKLKQLADVATFTTTGKVLNLLAKELGFGATKGATARTTMRAVVDNQVLPLLRDTFGAAFTKAEGDSLRNTLLDPDTAPAQMKATLDAFIEQKIRNIETSERELGIESPQAPVDLTQLSDEDLLQQLEAARGGQ